VGRTVNDCWLISQDTFGLRRRYQNTPKTAVTARKYQPNPGRVIWASLGAWYGCINVYPLPPKCSNPHFPLMAKAWCCPISIFRSSTHNPDVLKRMARLGLRRKRWNEIAGVRDTCPDITSASDFHRRLSGRDRGESRPFLDLASTRHSLIVWAGFSYENVGWGAVRKRIAGSRARRI